MTIANRIHIGDLPAMEIADIAALPVEQLALLQDEIGKRLAAAKSLKERFDTALDRRFAQRARSVRASHGKDTGAVHFDDGPVTISAQLPKRVKWDQSKLADIIETIRHEWGEDPAQYVRTEIKVPETAYASWPEIIREQFRPARTVKTGKPSYRIELKEGR